MDILEAIYTRRSIRKFTGQVINNDDLNKVLKAGFSAPSAHNIRPWHFIVVKDQEKLKEIAEIHPYAKMLPRAACGIIVCGDQKMQNKLGFLVEDCSAAIENMLLAAHGIGLGAVWCGLHPIPDREGPMVNLLNLPANIIPVGMVVVGYPAEDKRTIDRYEKNKIHIEEW